MTTMGYLLEDQQVLVSTAVEAFNRRKQLCPFPMEAEELIDVMHSPMVASLVRDLRSMRPKALHWDRMCFLVLPTHDPKLEVIRVGLKMKHTIAMAVETSGPPEIYNQRQAADIDCWYGPATVKLLDWAWKATQVELENRWAMRIVRNLVSHTTTHQQVHRYMPELYNLLAQQQDATIPKTSWNRRRICDVHEALKEVGSRRATKVELKNVEVRDRANLKALVAQTLMIKVHDGLKDGSVFDETWVDLPLRLVAKEG